MIIRSTSKAEEKCRMCDRFLPPGQLILRKRENDAIICILCLVEVAEIAGQPILAPPEAPTTQH